MKNIKDEKENYISVIIPCYNCANTISQTLESLNKQDLLESFEIIVVNNNSNDNSSDVIKSFSNVKLVHEIEIQNAAAARNFGVKNAKGGIVAFIDADCIAASDWLSQGIQAFRKHSVSRIGGQVQVSPLSSNSSAIEILDALYSFCQRQLVDKYQVAMSGNMFIYKDIFEKLGGFKATFFELEDIEFGIRADTNGYSISYAKTCVVFHPARNTFYSLWKKSVRNGRGSFLLCDHYPKWSGIWGWKHLIRPIKILLIPRELYWESISFSSSDLSYLKKLKIWFYAFLAIQLPEAWGYLKYCLISCLLKIRNKYFEKILNL